MISDFSKQADSVGELTKDLYDFLKKRRLLNAVCLAEQVKQRKMRAIGTRTQIQAIDRENSAKKVFRQGCQLLYLK